MSISVAPLAPGDHAAWLTLWAAYQAFYTVALSADVTAATWERIQSGRVHGLGVRDGSELIGFTHFLYHEDTWATSPVCYLQDLYVSPGHRGTGLGRKLIEAVADASAAMGASSLYWLTHETNSVGRRLYDRIGKNHGFIQYVYVDARR